MVSKVKQLLGRSDPILSVFICGLRRNVPYCISAFRSLRFDGILIRGDHFMSQRAFIIPVIVMAFALMCGGAVFAQTEPAGPPVEEKPRPHGLYTALEAGGWYGWDGGALTLTKHFGLDIGWDLPLATGTASLYLRPVIGGGYLDYKDLRTYVLTSLLLKFALADVVYALAGLSYQHINGDFTTGTYPDHFEYKQIGQNLYLNTGVGLLVSDLLSLEFQWRISTSKTNFFHFDPIYRSYVYESRHSIFLITLGYMVW
jgi:hypothetical protein